MNTTNHFALLNTLCIVMCLVVQNFQQKGRNGEASRGISLAHLNHLRTHTQRNTSSRICSNNNNNGISVVIQLYP